MRETTVKKWEEKLWKTKIGQKGISRTIARIINYANQRSSQLYSDENKKYPKRKGKEFWCRKSNLNLEDFIWTGIINHNV